MYALDVISNLKHVEKLVHAAMHFPSWKKTIKIKVNNNKLVSSQIIS